MNEPENTIKHEEDGDDLFKCYVCGGFFLTLDDLYRHIPEHELPGAVDLLQVKREDEHLPASMAQGYKREEKKPEIEKAVKQERPKGSVHWYTCTVCSKMFICLTEFSEHCRQCHYSGQAETCNVCHKSFPVLMDLHLHLRTHARDQLFLCSECGKPFLKEEDRNQHQQLHKYANRPRYTCQECSNTFLTRRSLLKHILTHYSQKTERPVQILLGQLKRKKENISNITEEERQEVHKLLNSPLLRKEPNYAKILPSCSKCGTTFSDHLSLKQHQIKSHRLELKLCLCNICGNYFASLYQYKKHLKTHSVEPVKSSTSRVRRKLRSCRRCCMTFSNREVWKEHIQKCYKSKLHLCDVCGIKCNRWSQLRKHMRTHGCEIPKTQSLSPCIRCGITFSSHVLREKHIQRCYPNTPKLCDVCGKTCTSLSAHMKIHRDEKPYKCSTCVKSFRTKYCKDVHERTVHGNEKNYMCHICGKTFTGKSYLDNHLKLHKGFRCNQCGETFSTSRTVHKHKLRPMCGKVRPHQCDLCNMSFFTLNALLGHQRGHQRGKFCRRIKNKSP